MSLAGLIGTGVVVGALGTLIGAGGGFVLVPLLILLYPALSPAALTAVSMAVVAANALSGSVAYLRNGRVDIRAGWLFGLCTIPGSILGVLTTHVLPRQFFDTLFGVVLIVLSLFLFLHTTSHREVGRATRVGARTIHRHFSDRFGEVYDYDHDPRKGALLSLLVGYFSPLLGIGGGIIHVPAMVAWLGFPVHVATATSHFVLALMAAVSVMVHVIQGNYADPFLRRLVLGLVLGVVIGAQFGAYLSRWVKGRWIVRSLAVALALVGLRILLTRS